MKKSAVAGLGTGAILKALFALAVGVSFTMAALLPIHAQAQEEGDGKPWRDYYGAFKGKKVGFVPIALGFDIPYAYDGALKAQAKKLGYNYVVRDPAWTIEAAVQIVEQFIAEKVDIIVIHPLDDKVFNRALRKAKDAGIYTIFVNMRHGANTDDFGSNVYIGPDHYSIGKMKVDLAAKFCETCPSKKIAIVQAPLTNPVGASETKGALEQLKKYPELKLVAKQGCDADASKAKAVTTTILKQQPDLCVIIGQWDGEDAGTAAAIAEAGLKGKVKLITSGSGSKKGAFDKLADGSWDAYISHNIEKQCEVLKATIVQLLQTKPQAGAKPWQVYIDTPVLTKEIIDKLPGLCWDLENITTPLQMMPTR